jgi:hypothetical protein
MKDADGLNDMFCIQTAQIGLLMYYIVTTMTTMAILTACSLQNSIQTHLNQEGSAPARRRERWTPPALETSIAAPLPFLVYLM